MGATVHLARIGSTPALHHVVEPTPLRGAPEHVRGRCGRNGEPTVIVRGIDSKAVRVREGVICVTCIDLAGRLA